MGWRELGPCDRAGKRVERRQRTTAPTLRVRWSWSRCRSRGQGQRPPATRGDPAALRRRSATKIPRRTGYTSSMPSRRRFSVRRTGPSFELLASAVIDGNDRTDMPRWEPGPREDGVWSNVSRRARVKPSKRGHTSNRAAAPFRRSGAALDASPLHRFRAALSQLSRRAISRRQYPPIYAIPTVRDSSSR